MGVNVTYVPRIEPTPLLGLTRLAYTVAQAAALLNMSDKTLYAMLQRGVILGIHTGVGSRGWRILAHDLEAYVVRQRAEAEALHTQAAGYGVFDR